MQTILPLPDFCPALPAALLVAAFLFGLSVMVAWAQPPAARRHTRVDIVGEAFHINGRPTFEGWQWKACKIEGLLPNARMVQGIFDDLNPETRSRWAYPDTATWDADRNTSEFVHAMADWRDHGLLAFTINLQGGSPEGYSENQPWHNSAFDADGSLRDDYMARLAQIIDRADELGMAVILGYFYFGQDERLRDADAVTAGVRNATRWVLEHGYTNVIIELNGECDLSAYEHEILRAERVHELIRMVRETQHNGRRLLAGTSFSGGRLPTANVVEASDFILLHGNGVSDPNRIAEMVRASREMALKAHAKAIPILFNEDDHYDFDKERNNFTAALQEYASWGFFDFRRAGEGYEQGYQSVPVDWRISSPRKKAFFGLLAEITGQKPR